MQKNVAAKVHFIGIVQRVGFRATVKMHASAAGLHGTVCNLPSGEVEMIVEGEKSQIEQLIEQIQRFPGAGKVTDIQVTWLMPEHHFTHFSIEN